MPELLLEMFSEEIPARMQARAAEDLKRLVTDKIAAAGLVFTRADAYVTPRRLALVVDGLPEKQPDVTEEKKGPRVGSPDIAIQGFLKGAGLTSLDQCEKRTVGKAEFWFATIKRKGQATADVLASILKAAIAEFPWPKSMRWGAHRFLWVRPLHRMLGLFGGRAIPLSLDIGVTAGDRSSGHRFLAPAEFQVRNFADYKHKLQEAKVILDPAERRDVIARKAEEAAKREKLTVKPDPGLLDEVTGLVEWPVVLVGSIDAAYMELPPEVLTTSMRSHQKYFALLTAEGALASRFVVVSNMETDEQGQKNIIAGNERVLRARLSDAKFFWDQDRKTALENRVPALTTRVFHARLGTVADKVNRMEALLSKLVPAIPGCDPDFAREAALLCKADLSSGMVGEFPELQGVMGRYYALHDGEPPEVADAIRDHYAPLGPNDRCPTAPASVAVALADRIDTLSGFWTIGEKPTGSKDPFALRRAALGVIRLVIENKLRLPLRRAFAKAFARHGVAPGDVDALMADLLAFFADRLKVHLREQGVRHDLIAAIFSRGGDSDILRILARVEALKAFLSSADGANLLTAYRRASNIVEIEEKKDKTRYDAPVQAALLRLAEEKTLAHKLSDARQSMETLLPMENFGGAMMALANLRPPIDAFFDKVTVNAPEADLRANRLRLLSEIRRTLSAVADFSKIEG
ncbi:MAG TPA: glycine--tRNA ligase subunit beta [Alphaproteobacteria bacterium]